MNPDPETSSRLVAPYLSEEQRMNRICDLLSKAVVSDWSSRLAETPGPRPDSSNPRDRPAESSDEERIVGYLSLVGAANAALIRETLGLSKMRVYRALQPLLMSGRVAASGRSRMTSYALTRAEVRKIVLN
ncbi:MAG: hypothetical protein HZA93_08300 [Verrucomicrobia bacterium]|nr:hypothetical protein [Verrucomicrobiota bacterium]